MIDIALRQSHAFWSSQSPYHDITALTSSHDNLYIITGSLNGDIILWLCNENFSKIIPILFFHNPSNVGIKCLETYQVNNLKYLVSCCENGNVNLYDYENGHTINSVNYPEVNISIKANKPIHYPYSNKSTLNTNSTYLYCIGTYPDIKVLDAISLLQLFKLCSKFTPNWITSFCFLHNTATELDVIIGISLTGCVKLWTLSKENISSSLENLYENEAKSTELINCKCITYCHENPKIFLMVTATVFQLYNVATFTKLCHLDSFSSEKWCGGVFINKNYILVWTENVKAYMFRMIPLNMDLLDLRCNLELKGIFEVGKRKPLLNPKYLYRSNFLFCSMENGFLCWNIYEITKYLLKSEQLLTHLPAFEYSLEDYWDSLFKPTSELYKNLKKICDFECKITSSLYLPFHDYYLYGTSIGKIFILQRASLGILESFSNYLSQFSKCQFLSHKSNASITYLKYPHSENPTYDSSYLLSAQRHSTICLWDLNIFSLIHTFSPHTSSSNIRDLIVLPLSYNMHKYNNLILSIAGDNTLSILNLLQKSCTTISSQMSSPINYVIWLGSKGYIVIGCLNGDLYVWQDGLLDRCVTGLNSEQIYTKLRDHIIWPLFPRNLIRRNKRRFIWSNDINYLLENHKTQISANNMIAMHSNSPKMSNFAKLTNPLLTLLPMHRTHPYAPYQIALYDLEFFARIFCGPLPQDKKTEHKLEELSPVISPQSPAKRPNNSILQDQRRQIYRQASQRNSFPLPDLNQLYYNASSPIRKRSKMIYEKKILISLLSHAHIWHLNNDIDNEMQATFEVHMPQSNSTVNCIIGNNGDIVIPIGDIAIGPILRTCKLIHLLTILNILERNFEEEGIIETLAKEKEEDSKPMINDSENLVVKRVKDINFCQRLKLVYLQGFLNKGIGDGHHAKCGLVLDIIISRLQNPCSPLSDACSSILSYLLFNFEFTTASIREKPLVTMISTVLEICIQKLEYLHYQQKLFLSTMLGKQTKSISQFNSKPTIGNGYRKASHGTSPEKNMKPTHHPFDNQEYVEYEAEEVNENSLFHDDRNSEYDSTESFYRKFCGSPFEDLYTFYGCQPGPILAFVLMGFIKYRLPTDTTDSTEDSYWQIDQYFSLKNPRLLVLTSDIIWNFINSPFFSQRLDHNLIQPTNNVKSFTYNVLCKAFSTWEPFLDLSSLFLRLLELCILTSGSKLLVNNGGMSLFSPTKSCLNKIAYMRPAAFITIINKEISKYMLHFFTPLQNFNAITQPSTVPSNLIINSREYLFSTIEMLIHKQPIEIINLLSETIDIYVYCGGNTMHRVKDWEKLLSPFMKFPQIAFNVEKKQLILGTQKALLYLYDFKTIKPEICNTPHINAIIAVSYSPDYKNLATLSYPEGLLVIWQITSTLFGIGPSQAKYLKSRKLDNVPHLYQTSDQDYKIGKLIWINNKVLLILFSDGTEQKFHL
ncbi:unnamed protein product [Gordionus sp. m RMFG-2023]